MEGCLQVTVSVLECVDVWFGFIKGDHRRSMKVYIIEVYKYLRFGAQVL